MDQVTAYCSRIENRFGQKSLFKSKKEPTILNILKYELSLLNRVKEEEEKKIQRKGEMRAMLAQFF